MLLHAGFGLSPCCATRATALPLFPPPAESLMNLTIHIDGGSRGNPGPAAVGVVITDTETNKPLHEAGYYLGVATNNVAEYQGLLHGLTLAAELKADEVRIFSDSELMVRQLTGDYRVKSPDLIPLFEQAQRLLLKVNGWQIKHVKREMNKRADELVNMALDASADVVVRDATGSGSDTLASPFVNRPTGASDAAAEASVAASGDTVVPRWSATVEGKPGACPMGCTVGKTFPFGPHTPKGFCVHAAAAMYMTDPFSLTKGDEPVRTACGHCGAAVRVEI